MFLGRLLQLKSQIFLCWKNIELELGSKTKERKMTNEETNQQWKIKMMKILRKAKLKNYKEIQKRIRDDKKQRATELNKLMKSAMEKGTNENVRLT